MTAPIIVVTGFERCGSSLTMQMIHAGGVEPHESIYPSYENDLTMQLPAAKDWLARGAGKSVKILEPLHNRPPSGLRYRFIWLDRNHRQQALSVVKYFRALSPDYTLDPNAVQILALSYRRDRPKCLRLLRKHGPILIVRFEDLIENPDREAARITSFVGRQLDTGAMASAVTPRGPECLPYFLEEVQLAAIGQRLFPIPHTRSDEDT